MVKGILADNDVRGQVAYLLELMEAELGRVGMISIWFSFTSKTLDLPRRLAILMFGSNVRRIKSS